MRPHRLTEDWFTASHSNMTEENGSSSAAAPPVEAPAVVAKPRKDAHLVQHDLATLDVTKLNPLSPEVISRQATINIGIKALLVDVGGIINRLYRNNWTRSSRKINSS